MQESYPFRLVNAESKGTLNDRGALKKRPLRGAGFSFEEDAPKFIPGEELETAINTAIALGEPLLITGEPGTGKTQAAYYAAYKLGIEPVIHFQVKSDTTARDLLYHFNNMQYFHDAHFHKEHQHLDKIKYVEKRALWEAIESEEPRVLLIDEIDKAPRDFPNDLLHELDKMEIEVVETDPRLKIRGKLENRPIVFITSNSERRVRSR